jgi:hypothetical protein
VRRRELTGLFRILTAMPIPIVVLILYFGLTSPGADEASLEVLEQEVAVEVPEVSVDSLGGYAAPPLDEFVDIVEKNLFSSSRKRPSVRFSPKGSRGDGSMVSGEYDLLGVVVAGGERSVAIIRKGGRGGASKAYKVGDDIDNMVVEEILYDRVILRQGENEKVLELKPREEEKGRRPETVKPTSKKSKRDVKKRKSKKE